MSKKIKSVISIALVIITIFSTFAITASAASYSTGNYAIAASNGSNVRSGAGTNYSKVGAASKGVTFYVSKVNGNWGYTSSLKCTNGTKSGWVCLDYCTYKGFSHSHNYNGGRYYQNAHPHEISVRCTSYDSCGGWKWTGENYKVKDCPQCYPSSATYYTLSYNANGSSGAPSSQRVKANTAFYLSSTKPTRTGYAFLGWSTNKNATSAAYAPGQGVRISSNITLYAVWMKGSVKTNYSTPLTDGYCYYINPACATNSVLDVEGWGKSSDTNIQLWSKGYTKNQRWQAVYYGSGYYYFIDYNSKLVLDVHGGIALNGKNVSTWSVNRSDAQLFRLISAGNGYYYIQSKINPSYYLDVSGGNSSNGTNIHLYQGNFSNAQKFKFTPVFNVSAAVSYAQKYTDNSGAMEGTYNSSTYNIYKEKNPPQYKGYDCANFISQCLYAGGLNATQEWAPVYRGQNYKRVTGGTTWVNASALFVYLRKQGFSYSKVSSNLKNIYKGDVVFMDFNNDGKADHSTICTGFMNGVPVFCAHSNWRKNAPYSTSQWSGGTAYVVHMSGYGT